MTRTIQLTKHVTFHPVVRNNQKTACGSVLDVRGLAVEGCGQQGTLVSVLLNARLRFQVTCVVGRQQPLQVRNARLGAK